MQQVSSFINKIQQAASPSNKNQYATSSLNKIRMQQAPLAKSVIRGQKSMDKFHEEKIKRQQVSRAKISKQHVP